MNDVPRRRGLTSVPRSRPRLGFAAGIVAMLLVTGCSSGGSSSSGSSTTASSGVSTASSSGTSRSAGCSRAASSGSVMLTVLQGSRRRATIVHVPTGYHVGTPVALVLNLHGSGSSAAGQEAFTGMDATADRDGFIVVYPQGAIRTSTGYDWNVPGVPLLGGKAVPKGAADDVAFLSRLITVLEQHYCINPHDVDATGFSVGARMTTASSAATSPIGWPRSRRSVACASPRPAWAQRAVPVVAFHGTADPVDPYGGNGQAYWTYSVSEAAHRWAQHDGCLTPPATTTPAPTVQRTTYTPCSTTGVVELYTLQGAGHTWPGGPPVSKQLRRLLGPASNAIDREHDHVDLLPTAPAAVTRIRHRFAVATALVMVVGLASCSGSAGPASAATAIRPSRVVVPVSVVGGQGTPRGAHPMVDVRVGHSTPVPLLLDTGSTGLQIFAAKVPTGPGTGVAVTSTPDHASYAGGHQLAGVVGTARITLGPQRTARPVAFGLVQSATCTPAKPACPVAGGVEAAMARGFYGILGIGTNRGPNGLANPILGMPARLAQSWSLHMHRATGRLVLGPLPTFASRTRATVPLTSLGVVGGNRFWDATVHLCLVVGPSSSCAPGLFDSGTFAMQLPGSRFPDAPSSSGPVSSRPAPRSPPPSAAAALRSGGSRRGPRSPPTPCRSGPTSPAS